MDTAATRTAVSYARLSENDGTKVGIRQQQRLIEKAAGREGLTIGYSLSDDDRSAFKTDTVVRSGYQQLLDLIQRDKVSTVLVKHADRLHRSVLEAEQFAELARKHRVVVVTSAGVRYLLDTADGEQAFTNAATQARYESRHRGERVSDSHEERALEGRYRGGGRRPFGWGVRTTRVKDNGLTEECIDYTQHNPQEAAEIQRWKQELLSGTSMAELLRTIKFPTVTGSAWNSRTVWQILTGPRVSGHSVYRGEIVARNAWDAILSDDEREALEAIRRNPSRKTSPGNTPKWLGSMIYRCGQCDDGTPMTCRYTNNGQRVYRCQVKGHCQHDAARLDKFIEDVAVARLAQDDLTALLPSQQGDTVDVSALRAEAEQREGAKQEAAQMFTEGLIDRAQLATITAQANERIAEINAATAQATEVSPLAEFTGINTAEEARTVWDDSLSLARKRTIIKTLFRITPLPLGRGRRPKAFNPASVRIEPAQTPDNANPT